MKMKFAGLCLQLAIFGFRFAAWALSPQERLARFADEGPNALADRLYMHWNTHATDVYVHDQAVMGVGGERAKEPTVMFAGNRSHVTNFQRPAIEDLRKRNEDERGLLLVPKAGGEAQWVPYGQTGGIIESVNKEIMALAKIAAETGREEMAFRALDVYLKGIYYRNVATDLAHGHMQTLFGMQSMETIHDDVLHHVCATYKILKPWIEEHHPESLEVMQDALRKWADVQIANGVADNNWDMMQLDFILDVALVLEEDTHYADGKGREYYIDTVLNRSSVRNLSIRSLAEKGYDPESGIWFECPGYSLVVLGDLARFAARLADELDIDIFTIVPVAEKAYINAVEYLFPDGMVIGFGDTHPSPLPAKAFATMARIARKYGRAELAEKLEKPLLPAKSFFHAPNASWLVCRSGTDAKDDIAFALNASLGNHQHANGISLELCANGYRIAPDAGIGWNLYSGEDYKEYYSRFPAHNTVMVNSRSNYGVMKSFHSFELVAHGDNWAKVRFREPATGAEQERMVTLVKDGEVRYFVDCFKSRVAGDARQYHDYYYHNLGDTVFLEGELEATDEIAFVESGIAALSYIQNKFARKGTGDAKAQFVWKRPEGDVITKFYMNGAEGRTFITALAPATEGLSRVKSPDYGITRDSRTPVLVARHRGDAWDVPFIAVIDPSDAVESVAFDGCMVTVMRKDGKRDSFTF
ncbi:MAG: heparinase II/III family protein [Kiritimatiellae bacterium]|nr:heparinase II/III family protein [Kiritimatiellia bacterium]